MSVITTVQAFDPLMRCYMKDFLFSPKNPPYMLSCCGINVCQAAIKELGNLCPNKKCNKEITAEPSLNPFILKTLELVERLQMQLGMTSSPVKSTDEKKVEEQSVLEGYEFTPTVIISDLHRGGKLSLGDFGEKEGEFSLKVNNSESRKGLKSIAIGYWNQTVVVTLFFQAKAKIDKKTLNLLEEIGGIDLTYVKTGEMSDGGGRKLATCSSRSMLTKDEKRDNNIRAQALLQYLYIHNQFPPGMDTALKKLLPSISFEVIE